MKYACKTRDFSNFNNRGLTNSKFRHQAIKLSFQVQCNKIAQIHSALFHSIPHAFSKALLFIGSGSIIRSMETIVGYSPNKRQNMALMGRLKKHVPITKIDMLNKLYYRETRIQRVTPCVSHKLVQLTC